MLKQIVGFIAFTLFTTFILGLILYQELESENWYVNQHDSQCEMNDHCHCYERFIKKISINN